jgi:hypothetical protein
MYQSVQVVFLFPANQGKTEETDIKYRSRNQKDLGRLSQNGIRLKVKQFKGNFLQRPNRNNRTVKYGLKVHYRIARAG